MLFLIFKSLTKSHICFGIYYTVQLIKLHENQQVTALTLLVTCKSVYRFSCKLNFILNTIPFLQEPFRILSSAFGRLIKRQPNVTNVSSERFVTFTYVCNCRRRQLQGSTRLVKRGC